MHYCEKYPNDFPTDMIDRARRERMLFWERIGIEVQQEKYKDTTAVAGSSTWKTGSDGARKSNSKAEETLLHLFHLLKEKQTRKS